MGDTNTTHATVFLEEDVAVGYIPDNEGHFTAAVFKVCIRIKDMGPRGSGLAPMVDLLPSAV